MAQYFEWMDTYSVGVKQFDDAHKRLIAIINGFCTACMENKPLEELTDQLIELIRYARHHFREEEEWMLATEYPLHAEHRSRHDFLFDQVLEFTQKFFHGHLEKSEITEFLMDWLLSHILGEDMKYRAHSEQTGIADTAKSNA